MDLFLSQPPPLEVILIKVPLIKESYYFMFKSGRAAFTAVGRLKKGLMYRYIIGNGDDQFGPTLDVEKTTVQQEYCLFSKLHAGKRVPKQYL